MDFQNRKANGVQGCSSSFQPSFQTFLKVLALLSLINFASGLDYKPNHWSYRNQSQYYESLQNVLCHKHNKYYIGVLQQSQLTIFYKSNLTLKNVYKMNPDESAGESALFKSDEGFRDFDFVWDQHVVAIASRPRFIVANLISEQYQMAFGHYQWGLSSIQITKSAVYVLRKYGPFGRYKRNFLKNNFSEQSGIDSIKFYQMKLPDLSMKMQVSEYVPPTVVQQPYVHGLAQQNADIQYLMFYKEKGIAIYSCSKNSFQGIKDCTIIRNRRNLYGVKIEKASFSADCTKVILEYDNKSPLLVIDLVKNQTLASIKQDSNVLVSEFYNYEATVVMVWNSKMQIKLYEVSTGLELASYDQGTDHEIMFISVDLQQEMLIMVTDQFIYQYNFDCSSPNLYYYSVGKCMPCSERCSQEQYCHNQTAQCIQHILINQKNYQQQQFLANEAQIVQDSIEIDQSQQVEQMDQVEQVVPEPVVLESTEQFQETYPEQEKAIIEALSQGVQIIGYLATYAIWTFTTIPVASFFLGFINFWTICSFYVLLDIYMPQFLRTSLKNLFIALNSSLFNSVGFVFSPKLFLSEDSQNQKIRNDYAVDFHLSLDFLLMNSENLIKCAFSILLYLIIWRCFFKKKSKTKQNQDSDSKNNQVKKNESEYTLNPIFMGFGQVISICHLFFLGLMFMKGKSGYTNFRQKLNQICLEISIGMLLCVSPFIITFIKLNKKYIKPVQKKVQTQQKKMQKISLKKRRKQGALVLYKRLQWIYTLQCNITLPFFIILGYVQACLIVNYLIFGFGIFRSFKEPNVSFLRRINNIAMALEIFIVNLAITLTFVFDYLEKQNQQFNSLIEIFCLGTILLGAFHQVMKLIIVDILIDFILKNCQKHFRNNKVKQTKTTKKSDVNNKEKQQQKEKIIVHSYHQKGFFIKKKRNANKNYMKRNKLMQTIQSLNQTNKKKNNAIQQTIQQNNKYSTTTTVIRRKKIRLFKKKDTQNSEVLKISYPENSQQINQNIMQ